MSDRGWCILSMYYFNLALAFVNTNEQWNINWIVKLVGKLIGTVLGSILRKGERENIAIKSSNPSIASESSRHDESSVGWETNICTPHGVAGPGIRNKLDLQPQTSCSCLHHQASEARLGHGRNPGGAQAQVRASPGQCLDDQLGHRGHWNTFQQLWVVCLLSRETYDDQQCQCHDMVSRYVDIYSKSVTRYT